MGKDPETLRFLDAKATTKKNLESVQEVLDQCVEEGMPDANAHFHNELLLILDEVDLSQNWDELQETITRAKTLEIDTTAWLATRGITTISLEWPHP